VSLDNFFHLYKTWMFDGAPLQGHIHRFCGAILRVELLVKAFCWKKKIEAVFMVLERRGTLPKKSQFLILRSH
jgi:hypothetical protein